MVAIALVGAAALALGLTELGSPASSARTLRETIAAEQGVVQSTVSGTGNVEPATDTDVNFKTSGTLSAIYVHVGQHVVDGQLLATLDPTSAQLAVDQAEDQLSAAEDQLTSVEDGDSTGGASSTGGSTTGVSDTTSGASTDFVSDELTGTRRPPAGRKPTTKRKGSAKRKGSTKHPSTSSRSATTSPGRSSAPTETTRSPAASATTTSSTPSPASIASAEASVYSAQASLRSAQQTLDDTKLYAPASGTIASLESVSVGDQISSGGTGAASSSGSSGSGSSSAASGSGGSSASTAAGSLGGSGSSASSSSSFAEIIDTSQLTMTVAFSESDITKVKVGQPATVTLDALPDVELAAHVSSISPTGTDSSGVVSYDATLTLDQTAAGVRPGMSASASVITSQASGVNLPNAAVPGTGSVSTVQRLVGGHTVATPVVVGLRGDSRTQIINGLKSGQQVVVTETLPALGTSSSSGSSGSSGTLGGTSAFPGAGGFGGGGGFRRFFGGGGGVPGG